MSSWRDDAACRDMPSTAWFPETFGPNNGVPAKAICAGCEVRDECLEYAIKNNETDGIWGGLNPRERQRLVDGAVLRTGRCVFCERPFTYWWEKGKAPRYCGGECSRLATNRRHQAWRNRRLMETG